MEPAAFTLGEPYRIEWVNPETGKAMITVGTVKSWMNTVAYVKWGKAIFEGSWILGSWITSWEHAGPRIVVTGEWEAEAQPQPEAPG